MYLLLFVLIAATAQVEIAAGERRITVASNVRLRNSPTRTAAVTAELPLGTELLTVARTNTADPWFHVRTDEGQDGWVHGSLIASFTPLQHDQRVEAIILEVLGTLVDSGSGRTFSTRLQLLNLIDRAAGRLTSRAMQARFAVYRLRSLNDIALGIPFQRGGSDPYRAWLRQERSALIYDEPGGRWMVSPQYVVRTHLEYLGTAAADDIAWFLVENGLPGECEGDLPCYVRSQDQRGGEYLRLHPRGRHAEAAQAEIARGLNAIMDNLQAFPLVLREFDPQTRCHELLAPLDALVKAVTAGPSGRSAETLAAADRFARLCR